MNNQKIYILFSNNDNSFQTHFYGNTKHFRNYRIQSCFYLFQGDSVREMADRIRAHSTSWSLEGDAEFLRLMSNISNVSPMQHHYLVESNIEYIQTIKFLPEFNNKRPTDYISHA